MATPTPQAQAKAKQQELLKEAQEIMAKKKTTPKVEAKEEKKVAVVDQKFAKIEENAFYQIVFSEKTLEEKRDQIAVLLVADPENKALNRERAEAFQLFKEYMQAERKRMSMEIIALTDTTTVGELKDVLDQMHTAITEFDESMKPLTDILDAVYQLRKEGADVTNGLLHEIQKDKAAEAAHTQAIKDKQAEIARLKEAMGGIDGDIAVLREQKGFFGWGGTKQSALDEIARKEAAKAGKAAEAGALASELEGMKTGPVMETQFGNLAEAKAKIRKMLDISSAGHQEQQKRLVDAATNYVNTQEARVGSILSHFGDLKQRLQDVEDTNSGTQGVYGILAEATTKANEENLRLRKQFELAAGAKETPLEMLKREKSRAAVDEHIKIMNDASVDTLTIFSEVVTEARNIQTSKDTTEDQINKTRRLYSSGTAGIASRLSSVLTAVNAAAINESAQAAQGATNLMIDRANAVTMQQAIKSALGVNDTNNSLAKAIDDLASMAESIKTTTAIQEEGLTEMHKHRDTLQNLVNSVQENLKEARGVTAKVNEDFKKAAEATAATAGVEPTNDNATKPGAAKPKVNPLKGLGS